MEERINSRANRLTRVVHILIEPSPDITDILKRRQAKLLASLLLLLILLGTVSGLIQLAIVPGFLPTFLAAAAAILTMSLAYALLRAHHYEIAAMLTCLVPSLASYAALWSNPREQSGLGFLLIGVFLGSILLSRKLTAVIACLNLLGLLVLPLLQPAWTYGQLSGTISYHVILPVIMIVAAWNRDLLEGERQRELAESELKFRSIFDHSVDAIGVSKSGTHVLANRAYLRMFGYDSLGELVGKPILDLIAPSQRAKILDYVTRRSTGERLPSRYETSGLRRDGTEFDMEVHVSTYELAGELYTVPILRDVTQRKQTEEALRASEVRYRAIVEGTTDLICRFLPDTTLTYVNEAYCHYFGQSREQLTGSRFLALIPEEDWPGVQRHVENVVKNREPVTYSHQVTTPGGLIRWQQWTDSTILDESGQVVELQSVGRDITEQRRAEEALRHSEKRYRTITELMSDYIFRLDIDPDGKASIGYLSENYAGITGHTPDQVKSIESWNSILHPDDLGLVMNLLHTIITTGASGELECRSFTKDGSQRWVRVAARPLVDQNSGTVTEIVGSVKDITERKRMEELLFEEKERAEITLHSIGDAVITTNVHACVEYLNPVAETLTGWRNDEAIGRPLEQVFHIIEEGTRQPALSPVARCLHEGRIVGLANHSILIRHDGKEFSIDDSAAPIRNRRGEMIGVVLVFHDVTEERRLTQQVAHDAMHDSLTGLLNRREFEKRLERALMSTKQHNVPHILCYLDLDQFKIVNDTAGHAAGDELLRQISGLLAGVFRQRDTFARLGGDEFGLLLENCEMDQALIIANEIKAKIRGFPFIWAGNGFQVGVSIGVVPITSEKESVNQLLSQADVACYSAKDLGRDRIYVYQAEDTETTQRHGEILQAARMRDAIFHDRFRLFCQPILQIAGGGEGRLYQEVLLRLADDEERLVLPSAFIPSAERYGLMPAIDRWVIQETFRTMAKSKIDRMSIAINLSGNSLDDETLLDYVLEQLREFSIPPEQICFEITETAAIHHLSKAQQFIQAFRQRGGKIALDDFGTGFSSFRYLKTLPVDFIKIDGSFVSDMLSNPGDLLMVEAMTKIAHTLGIQIIAEHASSIEIIGRLREIGVDHAQGFGIGRPVPVEEAWAGRQ